MDDRTADGRDHATMSGCSPQAIARLGASGSAQRRGVGTGPLQRVTVPWLTEDGVQAA